MPGSVFEIRQRWSRPMKNVTRASMFFAAALAAALYAAQAQSACGNRPGMPNDVIAEQLGWAQGGRARGSIQGAIMLSWKNRTRTGEYRRLFHDIEVTDGAGRQVGRTSRAEAPPTIRDSAKP
jgi:hypothetical protein